PLALAQCHRFTTSRHLRIEGVGSTAEACRLVAERSDPTVVAIASATAAARHGLTAMADDIGDISDDETRFVRVSRERPAPADDNRTTLVLVPPDDRTGVLVRMLRPFAARDLDVASIVTRPLKSSLGQYCFVVTCAGHTDNNDVQGAIDELLSGGVGVKHLGSYPAWRVDHHPFDHLPPGTTPGRPLAEERHADG
ncbi:MAG TPA: prephenate dehydratase domain-containing protein, partial [Acidimicrobiales bacterium]|nr:prephenate dehydratase domain-containing protein [Acidimicrobiales bacterium]